LKSLAVLSKLNTPRLPSIASSNPVIASVKIGKIEVQKG